MTDTCAEILRISITLALLLSRTGISLQTNDDRAMHEQSVNQGTLNHVRSLEPVLTDAFERGMKESPTFATVVSRLQTSDVIVYLVQDTCPGRRVVGCVAAISKAGGFRYIRINLVLVHRAAPTLLKQMPVQLVAQIGHELQHAIEIAEDASIVDARTLEQAYSRKRAHRNTVGFDTDAAIDTGEHVLRDLSRAR